MRSALLILNPREIPQCMEALQALDIPKCWVSYMPEVNAAEACNLAIQETDYDRYVVISDDTAPTQEALDAVLALHDKEGRDVCVTGYCQLAYDTPLMNLTTNTLPPPPPAITSYAFMGKEDIDDYLHDDIPTTFAGLAFTCMSRDLWLKYPLQVSSLGGQMDYVLSYNLAQAGVPIYAARGGYVLHVKERWNQLDEAPEKRLLIGQRPPRVTWGSAPDSPDAETARAPAIERHVQAPPGQRIVALLSYYDEPVRVLTGCLSGMAAAGVDHVIAVDGRYRLYPGENYLSPFDQTGSIVMACAKLGLGCTLHVPPGPWVGEVEKRSHMFMVALAESNPGDWFFIVDADELVEQVPGNLREQLMTAGENGLEVAVVTMKDMSALEINKPQEYPIWFSRRSFFRAQPIGVETNHHTYVSIDGRELWNAKPEQGQAVPALDLTGGRFTADGVPQEPTDPGNEVVVQHWAGARGMERILNKSTYYTNRENEREERGPCTFCLRDGETVQATRRVTHDWRKVPESDKPIADIDELCDMHAKLEDTKSRRQMRNWGMLCRCKKNKLGRRVTQGVCLDCRKPVDLAGVRVTERNGRPAIV